MIGKIDLVVAKHTLRLLSPESLVAFAIEALGDGHESPSLVNLAGLVGIEMGEAELFFNRAITELGIRRPDLKEAILLLARQKSRDIVSGRVAPCQGARDIWRLSLEYPDGVPTLDPFIYAASECDDRPEDLELFNKIIVDSAEKFLHSCVS